MALADRAAESRLCAARGPVSGRRPPLASVTVGAARASTARCSIDFGTVVSGTEQAPTDAKPGNGKRRRTLYEAAHKLGYFRPPPSAPEERQAAVRERFEALSDTQRDVVADAGKAVLALGALGVVYGDIGTSPLYTEQVIFTSHGDAAQATPAGVYGVVSL